MGDVISGNLSLGKKAIRKDCIQKKSISVGQFIYGALNANKIEVCGRIYSVLE